MTPAVVVVHPALLITPLVAVSPFIPAIIAAVVGIVATIAAVIAIVGHAVARGTIVAVMTTWRVMSSAISPAIAMVLGFGRPTGEPGHLWPHILSTLVGYHAFLAVLLVAFLVRRRRFRAG